MKKYHIEVDNIRFMRDREENTIDVLDMKFEVEEINKFIAKRKIPCNMGNIYAELCLTYSDEKGVLNLSGILEVDFDYSKRKYIDDEVIKNYSLDFFINYLNIIFLTLNLSNCGIISFVRSKIKFEYELDRELLLDSDIFGGAYNKSYEYDWIKFIKIDYETTYNWLIDIGIGVGQIAKNNSLRGVFVLSHCSVESAFNNVTIMWLSLGLESILGIGKEKINSTLRNRIFQILGNPSSGKQLIRDNIYDFYDTRSKYVHGESEIDNGMKNTRIDDEAEEISLNLIDMCDFGAMILIAIIQKMILSNKNILFNENEKMNSNA